MDIKGQTTLEFALTVLVLFTVLFALIDFAVMFYVNLTMQHAVREGARYAITGQGGNNRKSEMVARVRQASNNFYEKNASGAEPAVSIVTPTDAAAFSNYTGRPVDDTGKPDEIIIVTLNYAWPLLTPVLKPFFGDNYTFTVRATMRNEPWWPK